MSDRDNFAGGFIAGAILGGILGGVLGATLTARQGQNQVQGQGEPGQGAVSPPRRRRWIARRSTPEQAAPSQITSEARIEEARRSLEDKIAQLNVAIDDARQQLNEPSTPDFTPEPSPSEMG